MPEGLKKIKVSLRKHNHSLVNWVQIPETMNQLYAPYTRGIIACRLFVETKFELENKEYAGQRGALTVNIGFFSLSSLTDNDKVISNYPRLVIKA